ncbi:MAG TPA: NAD(P)-dependent oxidoreductase [Vineibacter sp.]|nr:NAD(P)-dependent oxidoreductase [Vineibacter sp.]
MRIGFIGLGTMGTHMARHLQEAGHTLVVHDARRAAAEPHVAAGAQWADTPRAVAAACEIMFTSLPGPPEVETVALGKDGLIEGTRKDAVYLDLSTNSRATVRKIHAAFAEKGAHMLDAPVSGGPRGAATRKLALWVGGERAIYDRCKPVLDAIGDQARYIGPIGQATVAKLVHNVTGYAISVALAEAFTMGVKAGVDPLTLFEAVRAGAIGRRRTYDYLVDQFLPGSYDPPAFALRLAHKDVSLAAGLGREVGVPMRLSNLTLEDMTEALGRGWADRDSRVVMKLQQERAGVDFAVDRDKLAQSLKSS